MFVTKMISKSICIQTLFLTPFFLTTIFFVSTANAFQAEDLSSSSRTWTDSTGKFKIEAKLLQVVDGKAKLKKADDLVIDLPLQKLSADDVSFIEELRNKAKDPNNPFTSGYITSTSTSDPFAGGKPEGSRAGSSGQGLTFDRSRGGPNAKNIMVESVEATKKMVDKGWIVEPDPESAETSQRSRFKKLIKLPPTKKGKEALDNWKAPKIDYQRKFVAVTVNNRIEDQCGVGIFDLETGENIAIAPIPAKSATLLAIDSDNRQLLVFVEGERDDPDKIEFRSFDDLETPTKTWQTGGFGKRDGFTPKSGYMLGPNRLLTLGNKLVLWDVSKAEPIYAIDRFNNYAASGAVISPNRKMLAYHSYRVIALVDVTTGELQGEIPKISGTQSMAFSPSGTRLAGITGKGQIWIWDLEENRLLEDFKCEGNKDLVWVGDEYLLAKKKYLMSIEYRACVWEYDADSESSLVPLGDEKFAFQEEDQLAVVKLPHKDFTQQIQDLDPDELLLIKPGDEFAIDFDLPFDEKEKKKILQSVEERMQKWGHPINKDAAMTIRGSVQKEKPRKGVVKSWDNSTKEIQVQYTPHRTNVEIVKDEKVIWRTGYWFGPGHDIENEDGESAQEFVDRVSKPTPQIFYDFKVPKNLAALPGGKPFGESPLISAREK